MAILSSQEAAEKLKKTNKTSSHKYISKAVHTMNGLAVHFYPIDSVEDEHSGHLSLQSWMTEYVQDKSIGAKLRQLMRRYPTRTTGITSEIYGKISRVMYADNKRLHISSGLNDGQELGLRQAVESVDLLGYIEKTVLPAYPVDASGWVLVDRGQDGNFLLKYLSSDMIKEAPMKRASSMDYEPEYIIFKNDPDTTILVDDQSFYVLNEKTKEINVSDHNLGKVPAIQLSGESRPRDESGYLKESYGMFVGSMLDLYLYDWLSAKLNEQIGMYPKVVRYKARNNYEDPEEGREDPSSQVRPSKVSEKPGTLGPGRIIEVAFPIEEKDADLMSGNGPLMYITPPMEPIERIDAKLEVDEQAIIRAATGYTNPGNDSAKNVIQVGNEVEAQRAVLERVRSDMERLSTFIVQCMAKYLYPNATAELYYSLGDRSIIPDPAQAIQRYDAASKAGVPQYILSAMAEDVTESLYSGTPNTERSKLLGLIEPASTMSIDAFISSGLGTDEDRILKLDFARIIRNFEAINGKIENFARDVQEFPERARRIKEAINLYINERSENPDDAQE